ncbi:hypothetical protein KR009_008705, partial [Drosophila setifemur]
EAKTTDAMVQAKDEGAPDQNGSAWVKQELFLEILDQDYPGYKSIKEFKLEPVGGKGENYTTLLLRACFELELKDGSHQSTSYMAKVLPNTATRDHVTTWKVFDKEHNTYGNYIPEFEKMYKAAGKDVVFGPRYYDTKKQVEEELIVLEDLGGRGFRNVNRQTGFDMLHIEASIEKFALFHAASAVRFELKGAYPAVYNRNLCSEKDDFKDFRTTQVKAFVEALPRYDCSYIAKSVVSTDLRYLCSNKLILTSLFMQESYGSQAPDMFQAYAPKIEGEFCVLNHGDAWCNNIMFQYDKAGKLKELLFVDMQMSRYSSPAQDLLYLILSSTQIDIKIKKFDYFVRFYHEKLTENLKLLNYPKKLPSLRSLHQAIFAHSDWILPIVTILIPIVLTDGSDDANMDTMMDNEGDAGEKFRNGLFHNPRIISHQKEVLPWAYNRGAFD